MARFLRRQVTYELRPPATLAAAPPPGFVSSPIRTELAPAPRPRTTRSRLSAPAVVAAATPAPLSRPPLLRLARAPRPRTRSQLRAPTVIGASYAPFGPKTLKAPHPRQGRQAHYLLRPPAVVTQAAAPFVAVRVRVQRAPAASRPQTHYLLRPPATFAAAVVFSAPPETLAFRVSVRRATEQHAVSSALFPPQVVNPAFAAPGQTRKLVRAPRQGRTVRFRLAPPATLAQPVAPFRPLQSVYATATKRMNQRRSYSSKLQPPAVVDAASGDNPVGSVFDPNYFLLVHP